MKTINIEYTARDGMVMMSLRIDGKSVLPKHETLPDDLTDYERKLCLENIELGAKLTGFHPETRD